MRVTRYRAVMMAVLAAVTAAPGLPAAGRVMAAAGAAPNRIRMHDAARQGGMAPRRPGSIAAPEAPLTTTTPLPALTPTTTPTPRPSRTPTRTPTATATATSSPTVTPTATPTQTPTPVPTNTPTVTPTPLPPAVQVLSVGVYEVVQGHEQHVTTELLGARVRLKIVVLVAHAPRAGIDVAATWALRGSAGGLTYYSSSQSFHLQNGAAGLFTDIVIPTHNFAAGAYLFVGTVVYHGVTRQSATLLHVGGQKAPIVQMHVHYARLHLTLPSGWHLDFARDSKGQPATGKDSLLMISLSGRALVDAVSVQLDSTPTTDDLHAFPPQLLQQEFTSGVTNVQPIFFKDKIDGHGVFAAEGNVSINGRRSLAIEIVTNKKRQFYSFTVINYFKRAPQSEVHAAFTAVFGVTLD